MCARCGAQEARPWKETFRASFFLSLLLWRCCIFDALKSGRRNGNMLFEMALRYGVIEEKMKKAYRCSFLYICLIKMIRKVFRIKIGMFSII